MLNELNSIDYIMLVCKASDNRLGASLKWVYLNIENMFAQDLAERILVMCTFSDGKQPLALDAVR